MYKARSVYEYSSEHDEDLTFAVGEIIEVVGEEDDQWLSGHIVNKDGQKRQGIFPKNFIERIEEEAEEEETEEKEKEAKVEEEEQDEGMFNERYLYPDC